MSAPIMLVCGSRDYPSSRLWFVTAMMIQHRPKDAMILTGGADGVDAWAHQEANRLGYPTDVMEVTDEEYARYRRRAPLIRDIRMLERKPQLVLAFHHNKSPGTAFTIREAYKRAIPFIRFSEDSAAVEHQAALAAIDETP